MGVLQHRLWEPRGKPTGCLAGWTFLAKSRLEVYSIILGPYNISSLLGQTFNELWQGQAK